MPTLHVEAEADATAPPSIVWHLLADANSYCASGPWNASGYQDPGGQVGAGEVRWLRYGRTTTIEQVLEVEVGRRLTYTVIKGLPVRNYRAEVTLTPTSTGTHLRWSADWDRTLAGRLVHRKLRTLYPEIVAALLAAATTAPNLPDTA